MSISFSKLLVKSSKEKYIIFLENLMTNFPWLWLCSFKTLKQNKLPMFLYNNLTPKLKRILILLLKTNKTNKKPWKMKIKNKIMRKLRIKQRRRKRIKRSNNNQKPFLNHKMSMKTLLDNYLNVWTSYHKAIKIPSPNLE